MDFPEATEEMEIAGLEFARLVARMRSYAGEHIDSDDAVETMNRLICEARRVCGVPETEEPSDEERTQV